MTMTAIYWGAFDPPTEAHKAIIEAAAGHPLFHDLIVVINNHPYKKYIHTLEKRQQLMQTLVTSKIPLTLLSQDETTPLNYSALKKLSSLPLCAIAGYDAYKSWMNHSSEEERAFYKAIAVIPRGDEEPILEDKNAFLLTIDPAYRHISSSTQRVIL